MCLGETVFDGVFCVLLSLLLSFCTLNPTAPQSISTTISAEERGRRIALFVPVFERLVLLIRGRVRYPSRYDQWHRDERADFKRSRYAIGRGLVGDGQIVRGCVDFCAATTHHHH